MFCHKCANKHEEKIKVDIPDENNRFYRLWQLECIQPMEDLARLANQKFKIIEPMLLTIEQLITNNKKLKNFYQGNP